MILGDSLHVMASLAEREGLRIDKYDASGEGIGVSRCRSNGV